MLSPIHPYSLIVNRLLFCFFFLFLLSIPRPVFAVASAVIMPDGNSNYVIELKNCVNICEVELTVDYPLSMGTPEMSPGTIALSNTVNVTSNTSMLNLDLIAQKRPLPFGGTLASVMFPALLQVNQAQTQSDPLPVALSGSATDCKGNSQPLNAWYQGPNDPPRDPEPDNSDEDQSSNSGNTTNATPPSSPAAENAGGVQPVGGNEDRLKTAAALPVSENRISPSAEASQKTILFHPVAIEGAHQGAKVQLKWDLPLVQEFQSVLDRFKSFDGERTEAALRHLFETDPATPFRQTPAVALADGRTPVTVTFNLASPGQEVNVMVLTNVQMVSFKYLSNGTKAKMIVLPKAGSSRSSLMIKAGDRIFNLPLTVAPPLAPSLAELGVTDGKVIRRDYNGDGVIDYLDDYILMANRLVLFK